jgi:hypothetical protein
MAARFASNSVLASLVRESQDLSAAWRDNDTKLVEARSKPEGQRSQALIDTIRGQVTEIEGKLAVNAGRLDREFPDYATLANPKPLPAEAAQKLLSADEALVFFLAGDKESYVFALTRDAFATLGSYPPRRFKVGFPFRFVPPCWARTPLHNMTAAPDDRRGPMF